MFLLDFLLCVISCYLTYYLINVKNLCPVVSSSATTLCMCLVVWSIRANADNEFIIIFGGSFIGMSSSDKYNVKEVGLKLGYST